MQDREMTLEEHLSELRYRMLVALAVVGGLFLAGFFVARPVLNWLVVRADVRHIIVIGVPEAFFALIKVDLILSLIVASPVILYQVVAFVLPGLTVAEQKVLLAVAGPGLGLFLLGMAGGFFLFVPLVLHVMLQFVGPHVAEYWTLSNYLNFVIYLTVPFGFVAELPLVSGVLTRMGLVTPQLFKRYRRYAIVVAFFIAAVIAPPDALSMVVIGSAIYGVYEVAALVSRLAYRPAKPATAVAPLVGPDGPKA
jgi:sec-independent protein translocase protein TatC